MKRKVICECTNTFSLTIGSNKNQDASKKRWFGGKEMQTWEQLMVLVIIIHCTGINRCSLFSSNIYFKPLNIQNMN